MFPPTIAEVDREPVGPGTRFRDYILTDYEPAGPTVGSLHPVSVFRHLLRHVHLYDAVWPTCERLRGRLGPDQTVWALKFSPDGPLVELYFYNFQRNGPGNAASAQALASCFSAPFPAHPAPRLPYFMLSTELGRAGVPSAWRVYLGTGDRHRRQAGFSYRVEPDALVTENHYWFYRASDPQEREDALLRLRSSPRAGFGRAAAYPEELRDCHTICFAVKPRADGLYYSRVTSTQAATFFERLGSPGPELGALLRTERVGALRWDVGFDIRPADGHVSIPKWAIHGVF